MINFEKKVLDNGLRVILAPMNNTDAVTFLVLVKTGSRRETENINGISHFLEHMFFKSTKNRPGLGEVFRDLNKIGAAHNAFTSKETTGFWVKSSAKDADTSIDIISDILTTPLFKSEEMEKERNVIMQEIDMYEDSPAQKVQDVLENVLFGDQPLGWDIIGSKKTVRSIKREDIIKYEKNNYLSENMIIAAAGNIDKDKIFKKIAGNFSGIKKGNAGPFKKVKIQQKNPQVRIVKKDLDQTHFAMAVRSHDMFDEKRYALNLLSVIMGGNSSSRLFVEIREKLGLAYYVYSWSDHYSDSGYLGVAAGIPHKKLPEVVRIIAAICGNFKEKAIKKSDLNFAKGFLRGQMALKFESSDEIANFVAGQEMFYNKTMQPADILKKIERLGQEDVLSIAREIFRPERINVAVIGRQKNDKKTEGFYKNIFRERG